MGRDLNGSDLRPVQGSSFCGRNMLLCVGGVVLIGVLVYVVLAAKGISDACNPPQVKSRRLLRRRVCSHLIHSSVQKRPPLASVIRRWLTPASFRCTRRARSCHCIQTL